MSDAVRNTIKPSPEKFSSRMGAVAAAAGSAVGLGNVWRFPYVVGEDGGAVFLLLYVIFTALISIPIMMTEFAIGRKTGLPVTSAFSKLAPGSKWGLIGVLGMLTAFLIISYYNIVSGWTLYYSVASVSGWLDSLSEPEVTDFFSSLSSDPFRCIIWMVIMLTATAVVVAQGVSGGIEKYSKILMPLLFILILVMVVRAMLLPGGLDGLAFFVKPDFSKLTTRTVFDALGQSFFSLSIGMGTMTTYGSYLRKTENISSTAIHVASIDFLVAFLSGAVIFPCVFAFGINPGEGPGLVFVTLPNIFNQMPFGRIFSSCFFLLLVVAALTSSVSLLEVVVAYFKQSFKMGRRRATILASVSCLFFGLCCSLSQAVFNIFDNVTANIMMPIGALLIVIFAVTRIKREDMRAELEKHGKPFRLFNLYYFLVRYVVPVVIGIIFINGIVAWLSK
ncbi:MAG: sodium-dependent transporter [Bacteroidales bacterium]|nr:sodium-dependent transporter [Bacteroidales bacterium]